MLVLLGSIFCFWGFRDHFFLHFSRFLPSLPLKPFCDCEHLPFVRALFLIPSLSLPIDPLFWRVDPPPFFAAPQGLLSVWRPLSSLKNPPFRSSVVQDFFSAGLPFPAGPCMDVFPIPPLQGTPQLKAVSLFFPFIPSFPPFFTLGSTSLSSRAVLSFPFQEVIFLLFFIPASRSRVCVFL